MDTKGIAGSTAMARCSDGPDWPSGHVDEKQRGHAMHAAYDAEHIRRFYDDYAEREWERLEATPRSRVSFQIHRHYLQQFVKAGDHVVEAGAGPGRFTIELARLGARIVVGDISPVQLALNRERVRAAGYEDQVVARELLDIVDCSRLPEARFDAVVCYGGALSYVLERADAALDELLRVTKPGGYLFLGVMSLIGTVRQFLPGITADIEQFGLAANEAVMTSGDLTGAVARGHHCHMYRWSELASLLQRHACTVVAASASNCLSTGNEAELERIAADPDLWQSFLRWEIDFCKEPGALDGGTHLIAVVQRH